MLRTIDTQIDADEGESMSAVETPPAAVPPGVEILPPPHAPRDSIAGITVLIIDGKRFYRDLVRSALASQGIRTFIEAPSVVEAKKRMGDIDQVDLIILEYDLDGENGIEFTRRIRRSQTTFDSAIPVVMVSASTREDLVIEARNAGVHEFVSKPFDIGTVVARVSRPFQHPRKFIVAPNYVGPDRRWERDANDEQRRRAEDRNNDGGAGDTPPEIETTIDKYQRSREPSEKKIPPRKGLDRFKPFN